MQQRQEFTSIGSNLQYFFSAPLVGNLILQNHEDKIGIAKEQEFLLRNWNYYELQTKIIYKTKTQVSN